MMGGLFDHPQAIAIKNESTRDAGVVDSRFEFVASGVASEGDIPQVIHWCAYVELLGRNKHKGRKEAAILLEFQVAIPVLSGRGAWDRAIVEPRERHVLFREYLGVVYCKTGIIEGEFTEAGLRRIAQQTLVEGTSRQYT